MKAQNTAGSDINILLAAMKVYEITNQRDNAFETLNKLIEAGGSIEEVHNDPDFAGLRSDPRYDKIIK